MTRFLNSFRVTRNCKMMKHTRASVSSRFLKAWVCIKPNVIQNKLHHFKKYSNIPLRDIISTICSLLYFSLTALPCYNTLTTCNFYLVFMRPSTFLLYTTKQSMVIILSIPDDKTKTKTYHAQNEAIYGEDIVLPHHVVHSLQKL